MGAMFPDKGDIKPKEPLPLDHERQDFERVVKRRLAAKFDDWPNEAGVCQPIIPRSREGILTQLIVRRLDGGAWPR
jgi:hypothetical protein